MTSLEVLVVDRGVGVPPEDPRPAFDKFYRVAENGSSSGLGLGLAICKAFIEAHNGRASAWRTIQFGGAIVRFCHNRRRLRRNVSSTKYSMCLSEARRECVHALRPLRFRLAAEHVCFTCKIRVVRGIRKSGPVDMIAARAR